MTRSFSHYTDGNRVYLSKNLKIFFIQGDVVFELAPSRASSLPQGYVLPQYCDRLNTCGSGLAREGASIFNAK